MKRLLLILSLLMLVWCAPVWGGTAHYVDCTNFDGTCDGSGDGSGTFAAPWECVGMVNDHAMSTGDDVYFKEATDCTGTELDDYLNIDWGGTSVGPDYVTIGCYDGDGDFDCDSSTLPILDGNDTYPACSRPYGCYIGLIHINDDSLDYIEINDIQLIDSRGIGLAFDDPDLDNTYTDHVIIDNVTTTDSWRSGMLIDQVVTFVVSNSTILDNNECVLTAEAGYGAHLEITSMFNTNDPDRDGQVIGNIVSCQGNQATEGIGLYKGTYGVTVERNKVYDCKNVLIYLGTASHGNIIRHNLLYSTDESDGNKDGAGIIIICEDGPGQAFCVVGDSIGDSTGKCSDDHQIYGNLIAATRNGIAIDSECYTGANQYFPLNNLIYNNTIVDPGFNSFWFGTNLDEQSTGTIKNNLSYQVTGDATTHVNECGVTGYTWDDNLYNGDTLPSSGACKTGEITNNPLLLQTTSAFWRNLTSSFNGQAFALQSGTAACPGAGVTDLGSGDCAVTVGFYCGFDNQNYTNTDFSASPIAVDLQDRDDNPAEWCAGAFEWLSPPDTVPNKGKLE